MLMVPEQPAVARARCLLPATEPRAALQATLQEDPATLGPTQGAGALLCVDALALLPSALCFSSLKQGATRAPHRHSTHPALPSWKPAGVV